MGITNTWAGELLIITGGSTGGRLQRPGEALRGEVVN